MNLVIFSLALKLAIVVCGSIYGFRLIFQGGLVFLLNKFRTKRPYSEIDPKIAPLVSKMNATGVISTIASCQGYFCTGSPYVFFFAPVEIAAAIEKRLREASMYMESWNSTGWNVEGRFNGEHKLAFTIRSPDHDGNYRKLWWSTWHYGVIRRRLDVELLALADVIEEAILLHLKGMR